MEFGQMQCIGRGTFGSVYRSTPSARHVFKKLRKKDVVTMESLQDGVEYPEISSLREVVVLRAAQGHPNVIRWRKLMEGEDDTDHIVLEIEYGGCSLHTLSQEIQSASVLHANFPCIAWQVVSAITHLHRRGIQHMDLSPSNILYCPEKKLVHIIDFGMCSFRTKRGYTCAYGCWSLLAPEALAAESEGINVPRETSGVWGVMAVLSMLLTGKTPVELVRDAPFPEGALSSADVETRLAAFWTEQDPLPISWNVDAFEPASSEPWIGEFLQLWNEAMVIDYNRRMDMERLWTRIDHLFHASVPDRLRKRVYAAMEPCPTAPFVWSARTIRETTQESLQEENPMSPLDIAALHALTSYLWYEHYDWIRILTHDPSHESVVFERMWSLLPRLRIPFA